MSKVDAELLVDSLNKILAFSKGEEVTVGEKAVKGKKRKFRETVELQVTLKNYDPKKDKRFAGTVLLPHGPIRPLSVGVLATVEHAKDVEELKDDKVVAHTVEKLKGFKKNKKLVKKLAKKHHAFLASQSIIKLIPRLLGPGLNRAGKFPTPIAAGDTVEAKVEELRRTVKFQMKKVICLNTAVGNVSMTTEQLQANIVASLNLLVSMLKKKWQNVKCVYIKSSMGPSFQIFF